MYVIIYDIDEETRNVKETYEGNWHDLQIYLKCLRAGGCYNIDVTYFEEDE